MAEKQSSKTRSRYLQRILSPLPIHATAPRVLDFRVTSPDQIPPKYNRSDPIFSSYLTAPATGSSYSLAKQCRRAPRHEKFIQLVPPAMAMNE